MSSRPSSTFAADLAAYISSDVSSGSDTVTADTDLVTSGMVDSLGVMRIVDWIEQRLAIRIDPGDVVIEHFESVGKIVEYLEGRDDCTIG